MRVVFMGTPDFSVPTLNKLIESKHDVVAVITQPDKPKGRGKKMAYPPVKELALQHDIRVYQPSKVRDDSFIDILEAIQPDVIVVIAFGQILPKRLLELPPYGCINIHASLLPKYRGAGPIQWSIINGEKVTGITTMYMDVGLDTGDMLLKEEVDISSKETGGSLHDKLSLLGGNVLLETLNKIEDGRILRIPQDNAESTYAPMLDKSLGNIDWNKRAIDIERLIRGLNPWPTAYSYINGKLFKIWKAEVIDSDDNDFKPGTICEIIKNRGFVIKCGENSLLLTEVQLQGKKRMDAISFLNGIQVNIGQLLTQAIN